MEHQRLPCTEQLGKQSSDVDSLVVGSSLSDSKETGSDHRRRPLTKDSCGQTGSSAHLVVALAVRDASGILLVEIEAVLHQELHRLRLDDVLLRTQQGEVVHLHQVRVGSLHRKPRSQSVEIKSMNVMS